MPAVNPTMTLKQFETALRKSKQHTVWHPNRHRWNTGIRGHLRHEPTLALIECCPITAVAFAQTGVAFPLSETTEAAAVLGLRDAETRRIITAADTGTCDTPDCASCVLRARLLACVGLPPEEPRHASDNTPF